MGEVMIHIIDPYYNELRVEVDGTSYPNIPNVGGLIYPSTPIQATFRGANLRGGSKIAFFLLQDDLSMTANRSGVGSRAARATG